MHVLRRSLLVLAAGLPAISHAETPVGGHGMAVFGGREGLYASHLPMFHTPHDSQILLRFRRQQPPVPPQQQHEAARPLLSAREQEVLELITKGFTADEIAELISVSRHTVLTFVRRSYKKLQVSSKAEAIYEARNQGLLGS